MCLHAIQTSAGIIVFSILYGFFSGGLISLQSACVAQITPDMSMIGIKIGLLMAICSFGYVTDLISLGDCSLPRLISCSRRVLTGCPIGGALISSSGGAFGGFIDFSSIILLAGAFLVLCARLVAERSIFKVF